MEFNGKGSKADKHLVLMVAVFGSSKLTADWYYGEEEIPGEINSPMILINFLDPFL